MTSERARPARRADPAGVAEGGCAGRPSSGTRSPAAAQASAHCTPGPPALVMIATRSPRGAGWRVSSAARSNISASVSVRITPAWRKRASTWTSDAASSAPGVRRARRRRGRRTSALDRDHRLGRGHAPRHRPEPARVAERLQVEQDRAGAGVALPVLQEVVARQVGLVAHRHERGEADAALGGEVERGDPERAALRREGDAPRLRAGRARTSRRARPPGPCSPRPRQCGPTRRMPLARQIASSSARSAGSSGPSSSDHERPHVAARGARPRRRRGPPRRGARAPRARPCPGPRRRAGTAATPAAGAAPSRRAPRAAAPVNPPRTRLPSTAAPTVPGAADAAATSTDAGRRTCPTAATAASRSRAANRRRPSSVGDVGKRTCSSPGLRRAPRPGSPRRGRRRSCGGCPASSSRRTRRCPPRRRRRRGGRAASSRARAPPTSPSIAKATSASPGSARTYIAWPTTRSGAPVSTSSARPSRRRGEVPRGAVEVDARAEEAEPARLLPQAGEEVAHRGGVVRGRGGGCARSSRRAGRRRPPPGRSPHRRGRDPRRALDGRDAHRQLVREAP